jgi:hypothetical protein
VKESNVQHLIGRVNGEVRRAPFSDWLAQVDRVMERQYGFTSTDVEDWPWWSDYNIGTQPREAVREWAEENLPC